MQAERPAGLDAALATVRAAIGDQHVTEDPTELERAATATFRTDARPVAIVRPETCAHVQMCLRAFHAHRVSAHPISRGRNWGLGSRVPPRDGSVLMDLSRMTRIVAFDDTLGTLTVEPGVTFQQAYDHLRAAASRFFLSTTGSSPEASVIGNALERGDGSGPHGDHFAHVCGLEVVLPTGERLQTGFARFGAGPIARLHRWGVGPHLDGLFSQSGLGVVTQMTVFLQPLPRALTVVRFGVRDASRLAGVIDALRELRLDGTVDSAVGLWNDYRVVSARMQYPWGLSGAAPPLSRAALRLAAGSMLDAWYGALSIYAPTPAQAEAHWRHVETLLGPRVDTIDVQRLAGDTRSGSELGDPTDPALSFYQGVPHRQSLRSTYWRKRMPIPDDPDPDRDRCGVIWACPTVPLIGEHVDGAVRTADETLLRHGFEPMLVVIAATPRTAYLIPLVLYDRDVPGEDERAMACHDELLARMVSTGYLPHRLGNHSMGALPEATDDSARAMAALRRALDPHDVLGPGRYDPGATAFRK